MLLTTHTRDDSMNVEIKPGLNALTWHYPSSEHQEGFSMRVKFIKRIVSLYEEPFLPRDRTATMGELLMTASAEILVLSIPTVPWALYLVFHSPA